MALIKSISGIRGTIGGRAGEGLTPLDIVRFTAAYAAFMKQNAHNGSNKKVVGRDLKFLEKWYFIWWQNFVRSRAGGN